MCRTDNILGECLAFLASGSDPTCLLGACQMPSDDVKETLCHFDGLRQRHGTSTYLRAYSDTVDDLQLQMKLYPSNHRT